jgi:hypothetical protein
MNDHSIAHEQDLDGYHIVIRYAAVETHDNPRTNQDNVGTMICFHRGYNLGDKHEYAEPLDMIADLAPLLSVDYPGQFMDRDELFYWTQDHLRKSGAPNANRDVIRAMMERLDEEDDLFYLPLYLYEHSGITMSTSPFGDRWDSGQVGIIYVKREVAEREWPDLFPDTPEMTDAVADLYRKCQYAEVCERLKLEVTEFDNYITNSAYTYDLWKVKKPGKKYKRRKSLMADEQYPTLSSLADMRTMVEEHIARLNDAKRGPEQTDTETPIESGETAS